MDNITQRFIAISKRLLAELRNIGTALGVLHADVQQQIKAINTQQERDSQEEEVRPVWLDDILAKYEQAERNRTANDNRHHRVQNSIRWATWCAFFAASFYGAIAYRQWREMINATEATQQAVQEARLNRQQAEKSLLATIRNAQLDQRAWIGIDNIEIPRMGEVFEINVRFRNTGKTPATKVSYMAARDGVKKGERLSITYPPNKKPSSQGLVPPNGAFHAVYPPRQGEPPVDQSFFNFIASEEVTIYVYGKLTYSDIFSCGHWLTFCYRLEPNAKGWAACVNYNDTGDDEPDNCHTISNPK